MGIGGVRRRPPLLSICGGVERRLVSRASEWRVGRISRLDGEGRRGERRREHRCHTAILLSKRTWRDALLTGEVALRPNFIHLNSCTHRVFAFPPMGIVSVFGCLGNRADWKRFHRSVDHRLGGRNTALAGWSQTGALPDAA